MPNSIFGISSFLKLCPFQSEDLHKLYKERNSLIVGVFYGTRLINNVIYIKNKTEYYKHSHSQAYEK